MNETVVKVENVSKKFCRNLKRSMFYGAIDVARSMMGVESRTDELRKGEFWSVDNVSFELKRGETLGIIGVNGSGKTTLLRLLNGIYQPDKGSIEINGRIGALIAVGAGFHPLLTGRENIYLNGSILGMSKNEINKKFDAIVDFAEIGDAIDSPVKYYSSGMYVRLGFAIAINIEPDILLIDEILAVGDRNFQLKCYQKLHELKQTSTAIILIAHNEYTIREQAQRCIYLKNGKLEYLGSTEDTLSRYIKETLEKRTKTISSKHKIDTEERVLEAKLTFYDENWKETAYIESGQPLIIEIECNMKGVAEPILGVNFSSDNGFFYCINSQYENIDLQSLADGNSKIIITIPQFHLPVNNYDCSLTISDGTNANLIEWQENRYKLIVGRPENARGSLRLPNSWKLEAIE